MILCFCTNSIIGFSKSCRYCEFLRIFVTKIDSFLGFNVSFDLHFIQGLSKINIKASDMYFDLTMGPAVGRRCAQEEVAFLIWGLVKLRDIYIIHDIY